MKEQVFDDVPSHLWLDKLSWSTTQCCSRPQGSSVLGEVLQGGVLVSIPLISARRMLHADTCVEYYETVYVMCHLIKYRF